jgi:hypothetical protein
MFSAGPIAETEAAILAAVERDLLDGGIFEDALSLAVERLSRETRRPGWWRSGTGWPGRLDIWSMPWAGAGTCRRSSRSCGPVKRARPSLIGR